MSSIDITVIRSSRKTLALEINKNCEVIVRAPYSVTESEIREFVYSRREWLGSHLVQMQKRMQQLEEQKEQYGEQEKFTYRQIEEFADRAKEVLPKKAAYYASLMGVTYNRIAIKSQKTRWGSCSSKRNLNFNCLLMLCPEKVQDYVVIHELCHLIEMNHSKRFWNLVENMMPDYNVQRKWLKENGSLLIERLP